MLTLILALALTAQHYTVQPGYLVSPADAPTASTAAPKPPATVPDAKPAAGAHLANPDGSTFPRLPYMVPSGRDANGDVSFPSAFVKHGTTGSILNGKGEKVRLVESGQPRRFVTVIPKLSNVDAVRQLCVDEGMTITDLSDGSVSGIISTDGYVRLSMRTDPIIVVLRDAGHPGDSDPEWKATQARASPPDARQWFELGAPYTGYQGFGRKLPNGSIAVEWSCQTGTTDVRRGLPQPVSNPYTLPATSACSTGQCPNAGFTRQGGYYLFRGAVK